MIVTKIDDTLIKSMVLEYQKTGEGFDDILLLLSKYIYNYPKLHSQYEDACGDFYLYFCKRIKNSIKKYKQQDSKFITWFTVVLYRQYLNWVKQSKKEPVNSIVYLDEVFTAQDNYLSDNFDNESNIKIQREIIKDILDSLPKKVKIVMKLHYFEFFKGEDLIEASKIFKQDMSSLLLGYKDIISKVEKQYEKQNKYLDKVNVSYSKLSKIEDDYNDAQRQKLDRLIVKYTDQHEKRLKLYQKFYITVKNEVISVFLGLSLNSVNNLLYRGKLLTKDKIISRTKKI